MICYLFFVHFDYNRNFYLQEKLDSYIRSYIYSFDFEHVIKDFWKVWCLKFVKPCDEKYNRLICFGNFNALYSRAPADCLQYLTGVSNSFKSFNFGNLMIRNLQYDVCIRPESGYCRFQLLESSSTTDSFKIDPASTTTTSKVKLSYQYVMAKVYWGLEPTQD